MQPFKKEDFPPISWSNFSSRVYAIIGDEGMSQPSLEAQAKFLFKHAIGCLQIRMKRTSPKVWLAQGETIARCAKEQGIPLIINDRVDIAWYLHAGVHLGQEDLPPQEARKLLQHPAWIGRSCHTKEEIDQALRDPAITYIAIGPIYPTPFKPHRSPTGLSLVSYASGKGKPIVAIGGITPTSIPEVLQAGADYVAMIRGLWQ